MMYLLKRRFSLDWRDHDSALYRCVRKGMSMAANFETFVRLELPKRTILIDDVSEETVIVRRGDGARVLNGVNLSDGEVVAKVDGRIIGIKGAGVNFDTTVIPPDEEKEVDSYTDIGFARKWVVDVTAMNKSMAFEILVKNNSSGVSHAIYSKIGDKIPILVSTSTSGNSIILKIQNNYDAPLRVTSTVLR